MLIPGNSWVQMVGPTAQEKVQIDQSEDEMQAFKRINELVNRMLPGTKEAPSDDSLSDTNVLETLQNGSGLGHCTPEQWKHFIALRQTLTAGHARTMLFCQFHGVAG